MPSPWYVLAASVPAGNRIRRFFDRDADSPAYILEQPPTFRWGGFDLRTLDTARFVAEDCLEVRNGERKVLQLYQDGTFVTRAAADASFLGWPMDDDDFARAPRLNPVPVVEWHLAFAHTYRLLVPLLKSRPDTIHFRLELHDAQVNGNRLFLTRYYAGGIQNIHKPQRYQAYADNPADEATWSADALIDQPDYVAYLLVEKFASFFDMPSEDIDFVKQAGDRRIIDVDALRALRS